MKKLSLLYLLIFSTVIAKGQISINENFNASCSTTTGFPSGWFDDNTVSGTTPGGAWTCTGGGRDGTNGMVCTGDFSGSFHLDTSYLITSVIDISSATDSVYLQFDTKTTFISGSLFLVLASTDSTAFRRHSGFELPTINPIINPEDSLGWQTNQVNLYRYRSSPFFIAFRYVSKTTYGTKWYLDNVLTTTMRLAVNTPVVGDLPLTVMGAATTEAIRISFSTPSGGPYDLVICDMLGRVVSKQTIYTRAGADAYTITGLNMKPGMLFIKMGNGVAYGAVKAVVE